VTFKTVTVIPFQIQRILWGIGSCSILWAFSKCNRITSLKRWSHRRCSQPNAMIWTKTTPLVLKIGAPCVVKQDFHLLANKIKIYVGLCSTLWICLQMHFILLISVCDEYLFWPFSVGLPLFRKNILKLHNQLLASLLIDFNELIYYWETGICASLKGTLPFEPHPQSFLPLLMLFRKVFLKKIFF
jgi:hypothetical protein